MLPVFEALRLRVVCFVETAVACEKAIRSKQSVSPDDEVSEHTLAVTTCFSILLALTAREEGDLIIDWRGLDSKPG